MLFYKRTKTKPLTEDQFLFQISKAKEYLTIHYKVERQLCPRSILKWHLNPMKNTILPLMSRQLLIAIKDKIIITLLHSTLILLTCYSNLLRPFNFLLMIITRKKKQKHNKKMNKLCKFNNLVISRVIK
jgi:hypothetical protein